MKRLIPYAVVLNAWLTCFPLLAQTYLTSDMLPLTIMEPGYYVAVEPLVYPGAGPGILVTTNDVTLDLNGYTLSGPIVGASSGIQQMFGLRGLMVKNGGLTGWGNLPGTAGIFAGGGNNRFECLHIYDCGNGLWAGQNARVDAVTINTISGSGDHYGIQGDGNLWVRDSLVRSVNAAGIAYGIVGGMHGVVEHSVVTDITSDDAALGIAVSSGHVEHSVVGPVYGEFYAAGIAADDTLATRYCTVSEVQSPVESEGITISAGSSSTILRNAIAENGLALAQGSGLHVALGHASENALYAGRNEGVKAGFKSRVEHNVIALHPTASVLLEGTDSRLEGNLMARSLVAVTFGLFTNTVVIRNAWGEQTFPVAPVNNHVADVLFLPGVDFDHPVRSYYFENISW